MIEKGYRYTTKSHTTYEYGESHTRKYNAVQYYERLKLPLAVKLTVTFLPVLFIAFLAFIINPLFILLLLALVYPIPKYIWGDISSQTYDASQVAVNLRDEAEECCYMLKKLEKARALSPEGSGIHARTEEYGRMLFAMMEQLQRLQVANDVMGGSERDFYSQLVEIKNTLGNLETSGGSLVEITAMKRIDAVKRDIEFIGVNEFHRAVSDETAIYRALESGEDV